MVLVRVTCNLFTERVCFVLGKFRRERWCVKSRRVKARSCGVFGVWGWGFRGFFGVKRPSFSFGHCLQETISAKSTAQTLNVAGFEARFVVQTAPSSSKPQTPAPDP